MFVVCQIPAVKELLDNATYKFRWPGLHVVSPSRQAGVIERVQLNVLTTPGTQMLLAGILTMSCSGCPCRRAMKAYGRDTAPAAVGDPHRDGGAGTGVRDERFGETITLGTWMAAAGGVFAVLSPILGWLGVAVTGSDTSSNSLFGALQVTAADKAGLSPLLMAASNSSGGVLGKMISPQNLAIAAAAVQMDGKEGDIFRRVVVWSLVFLVALCALSVLQSSDVLSWMVPDTPR